MKILITGIYGFLGSNLANELQRENDVVGFYNKNNKNKLNPSIKVFNDLGLINFTPDTIIMCHAAVVSGQDSISDNKLLEVNVALTKKIIEKFPLSKCIYISSVSVYGGNTNILNEETTVCPISDYAKSKFLGELIVLKRAKSIIVRLSSLYGNGMKENTLIPNYCNQAISNGIIEVWGNGERLQNYIHISDAVLLIKQMISHDKGVNCIALGVSEKQYSNIEVAKFISEETNSKIVFVNKDGSRSSCYDNFLTRKSFDWKPYVNLNEGIKNYLEWKKKQ